MLQRLPAGLVLLDRYRIVAPLGAGQMAELYQAQDAKQNRPVALKLLPAAAVRNAGWRRAFENEARLLLGLVHPNVCRVYELCEAEGRPCIVMELITGEDLAGRVRRCGAAPVAEGLAIARQICAGLACVHGRGIVHRDLKPENILIESAPPSAFESSPPSVLGDQPECHRSHADWRPAGVAWAAGGRVKITDFGMAARAGQDDPVGPRAGTPQYMAPEQLAGHGATVRSDVYGLGLVLYELFTGRPAFRAATQAQYEELKLHARPARPAALVAGLPADVEAVILRCLAVEPAARFGSADEVAAALAGR